MPGPKTNGKVVQNLNENPNFTSHNFKETRFSDNTTESQDIIEGRKLKLLEKNDSTYDNSLVIP